MPGNQWPIPAGRLNGTKNAASVAAKRLKECGGN